MRIRNNANNFGIISIFLHWFTAVLVIALFFWGLWMVQLGYYDQYYHWAPYIHKSVGMLLLALMVFRIIWRTLNPNPKLLSEEPLEMLIAPIVHACLYLLVFAICISGYLMVSAADGSTSIFNWFEVPALPSNIEDQEAVAGKWHWYLALVLMLLVALHVVASLKHHYYDKNLTLMRMLGSQTKEE